MAHVVCGKMPAFVFQSPSAAMESNYNSPTGHSPNGATLLGIFRGEGEGQNTFPFWKLPYFTLSQPLSHNSQVVILSLQHLIIIFALVIRKSYVILLRQTGLDSLRRV